MNWILCGFKGCGKTHFASKIGIPFVDTDALIEEHVGLSIREIVQTKGYAFFQEIEEKVVTSLSLNNHIIAIGGGTLLSSASTVHLQTIGTLIFLSAPKSIIRKRLLTPPLPTYFDPNHPSASFEKMWSTRIYEYERICKYKVDLFGKSDEEIIEELWQVINLETSFGSPPGESRTEKQLEL